MVFIKRYISNQNILQCSFTVSGVSLPACNVDNYDISIYRKFPVASDLYTDGEFYEAGLCLWLRNDLPC